MDLEQFEEFARGARVDAPPPGDVADAVLARLRLNGAAARTGPGPRVGWIIAVASMSSAAAIVLAVLGYQALEALVEQAGNGWLDPFNLWVSL